MEIILKSMITPQSEINLFANRWRMKYAFNESIILASVEILGAESSEIYFTRWVKLTPRNRVTIMTPPANIRTSNSSTAMIPLESGLVAALGG